MKSIELKASAKINLSIDVLEKRADGYHEVAMVLQQIDLWDRLKISIGEGDGGAGSRPSEISVDSSDPTLPKDRRNLAYKAAALLDKYCFENREGLGERYLDEKICNGNIQIYIDKKIPMGAGLGGGSADAAAVLHGLNLLWGLKLPPVKLMELGVQIGADVPFLVMAQAASNPALITGLGIGLSHGALSTSEFIRESGLSTCALAEGIGEKLTPLPPLKAAVLLKKPDLHISTAEIYKALDLKAVKQRPDTKALIQGLYQGDFKQVTASMYNVLEEVATRKYPIIQRTIEEMKGLTGLESVMMTGSGPTVFAMPDPSSFY